MSPLTIPLLMASAAEADPVEVHRSVLEVVEQVAPQVPEGADGEAVRCRATVVIDVVGATRVEAVEGCSEAWTAAVTTALARWRWMPYAKDGAVVEARTVLPVVWEPATPLAPPPATEAPGATAPPPAATAPDGARVMHFSEVEVRKRVDPSYPREAAGLFPDVRCVAQVLIDNEGVPRSVDVRDCPEVFHEPTRTAVMRWRWEPPQIEDGTSVTARVIIVVNYRRR